MISFTGENELNSKASVCNDTSRFWYEKQTLSHSVFLMGKTAGVTIVDNLPVVSD